MGRPGTKQSLQKDNDREREREREEGGGDIDVILACIAMCSYAQKSSEQG